MYASYYPTWFFFFLWCTGGTCSVHVIDTLKGMKFIKKKKKKFRAGDDADDYKRSHRHLFFVPSHESKLQTGGSLFVPEHFDHCALSVSKTMLGKRKRKRRKKMKSELRRRRSGDGSWCFDEGIRCCSTCLFVFSPRTLLTAQ